MRGSRPSRFAVLLLLLLTAPGCASFYDEISLNADGSGGYRLVLTVKRTAVDADLSALEEAVRGRAEEVAREAGFALRSVNLRRDGSLLEIDVAADFHDLSVFASPALRISAGRSPWAFVVPREMSYRSGRFAARVLRDSAPPAGDPIRASFAGREGRFTVHFPGDVSRTNGEAREHLANWTFPLERLCDEPVEMTAVAGSDRPVATVALGGLLLLGLGTLLGSAFRSRRRSSGPEEARAGT